MISHCSPLSSGTPNGDSVVEQRLRLRCSINQKCPWLTLWSLQVVLGLRCITAHHLVRVPCIEQTLKPRCCFDPGAVEHSAGAANAQVAFVIEANGPSSKNTSNHLRLYVWQICGGALSSHPSYPHRSLAKCRSR